MNFPVDPTTNGYYVQLFEGLFLKQVLTVVIDKVNENMHGEDDLNYGEFLWQIGMWVLMLTVDGANHHLFWSSRKVDPFEGAPFCLTAVMLHTQDEEILCNLRYTKDAPPEYHDHFWEVRSMLKMWNENMGTNFMQSWINCIDETMSK